MSPTKASHRSSGWLIAAVSVLAAACKGEPGDGSVYSGSPSGVGYQVADAATGSSCATPNENCPCPDAGTAVSCGLVESRSGDYVTCSMGSRQCLPTGQWGTCEGTLAQNATREPLRPVSRRLLSLASTSEECINPCDPYCRIYNDDAGGLDGAAVGTNLSVDDGLEIATNCKGLQISPSTLAIKIVNLHPVETGDFAAFDAEAWPSECAYWLAAAWGVDKPDYASIATDGTVTIHQPAAMTLQVTAMSGAWSASALANVTVEVAETSSAPEGTAVRFGETGTTSDDIEWLYPYANTVLPLGIRPPVLQWDNKGVAANAVKISLRYPVAGPVTFDWSTILAETDPPRSRLDAEPGSPNAISTEAWTALERSARGNDALLVIQRLVGDTVRSEVAQTIHFADGPLKGRIYYTQYQRNGWGGTRADVMLVEPHTANPPVNAFTSPSGCPVCHSVSANGKVFVTTNRSWSSNGGVSLVGSNGVLAPVADAPRYPSIRPGTDPDDLRGLAWAALTPDGRFALQANYFWGNTNYDVPRARSTASDGGTGGADTDADGGTRKDSSTDGTITEAGSTAADGGMAAPPSIPSGDNGTGLPYVLWRIADDSGTPMASPLLEDNPARGLETAVMMLPSFSPDGTRLVFVDGDTAGGAGWRKGLSTFDFDPHTHTFSNRKSILSTWSAEGWSSGGNVIKFPVFESDSHSVIFGESTPDDLCYPGACVGNTLHGFGNMAPTNYRQVGGKLWSVDSTATPPRPPVPLDKLNHGEGTPTRAAAYEPTVLPTAAAGYRWVVFSSLRPYGNTQNLDDWTSECLASQLWIAALDDSPAAAADRSHPAFWLPNQHYTADCNPAFSNERGDWVVDPCQPAGATCAATEDCCQPPTASAPMACLFDTVGPPAAKHCAPQTRTECAHEGRACISNADCCDAPAASCLGYRCVTPPKPSMYWMAYFVRDFASDCPSGTQPIWRFFDWQSITPSDSTIHFYAQSAPDVASLDAIPSIRIAIAQGAPVSRWSKDAGVDVDPRLKARGQLSNAVLRITARLDASSDGTETPTLSAWRQSYDCVPAL